MLGEILDARRARGEHPGDFLDRIDASFADVALPERNIQVARDVMLIQMGAQSNLPAALAWTLVNLLLHPPVLEAVRAGDDALLERCAHESIRLAQRSITLRRVLRPLEVETEAGRYTLAPGVFLATMLSVTNPTAVPGLDRFDAAHYSGRRLQAPLGGARSEAQPSEVEQWPPSESRQDARAGRAAAVRLSDELAAALPARELVSTFGHGRHSCPAQRFSITAIRIAVRALLERFELTPQFASAAPRRRQIGGVARAEAACPVAYRLRSPHR